MKWTLALIKPLALLLVLLAFFGTRSSLAFPRSRYRRSTDGSSLPDNLPSPSLVAYYSGSDMQQYVLKALNGLKTKLNVALQSTLAAYTAAINTSFATSSTSLNQSNTSVAKSTQKSNTQNSAPNSETKSRMVPISSKINATTSAADSSGFQQVKIAKPVGVSSPGGDQVISLSS